MCQEEKTETIKVDKNKLSIALYGIQNTIKLLRIQLGNLEAEYNILKESIEEF